MRFRVRPPKNRELPLQLKAVMCITGNKVMSLFIHKKKKEKKNIHVPTVEKNIQHHCTCILRINIRFCFDDSVTSSFQHPHALTLFFILINR